MKRVNVQNIIYKKKNNINLKKPLHSVNTLKVKKNNNKHFMKKMHILTMTHFLQKKSTKYEVKNLENC